LKEFDLVRLDHFRGFESYWEIPAAEPTAARGRWVKGPQDDFFHVLRAHFGGLPFIAEALGLITPEVHALRERVGVPGMKVLQFGFSGPGARIYLPHNFTANCVVYTGTHDNDTTIGWWESGATQQEKDNATAYLGPMADGVHWAFIRAAYSSVAGLAIVPLQDVLGLGSDGRMNVPSESKGNWGWRYTPDALTGELAHKLASLAQGTDRAPAGQAETAKPDEPKA
ncbi:MAG TPA: 4-alpha-glucanotransferase, partial [Alphaproteobacteria bacterium]|nr:4-alpha-glucanotransferase [Alphaproteobacteria bacterium]